MRIPESTAARATRWFLAAAALSASGFYAGLHHLDNAMPVVDAAAYRDPPRGLAWSSERCWSNGRKLVASGWVARRGHGAASRRVRVVVAGPDGRLRALATSLRQRDDVSALLNRRFGDAVAYGHAGYTASLADPPEGAAAQDRVFLAYDDGDIHALLPLPCPRGRS